MSIPTKVGDYLTAHQIQYDTIHHSHSNNSLDSARFSEISPMKLAKAVILEDHDGHCMMAVVPGLHKIRLRRLMDELQREFHLIPEQKVYSMFDGCEPGAIPPIGDAYNMETVYDEALDQQKDVFFEAGDHQTLIHMKQDEFRKLMANHRSGRFSAEHYH